MFLISSLQFFTQSNFDVILNQLMLLYVNAIHYSHNLTLIKLLSDWQKSVLITPGDVNTFACLQDVTWNNRNSIIMMGFILYSFRYRATYTIIIIIESIMQYYLHD